MKMKTKNLSIGALLLIGVTSIGLIGCDTSLPEPQVPAGLVQWQTGDKIELVVKHISLFRQGIAFDILDTNQSRDATGVIVSGNVTKVNQDILIVEKKAAKESIDTFLANINKKAKKGCTYTIQTKDGLNNIKIHELSLSTNCKDSKAVDKLVYIYNSENPEKVIKIEQANKYAGPRSDKGRTKPRYESLQFL